MTTRLRPAVTLITFATGMLAHLAVQPASAQWADLRYANRLPITVVNSTTQPMAAGDVVAASVPTNLLAGKIRSDGADAVMYSGATALPTKVLVMSGTTKVLFPLPVTLPGLTGTWSVAVNDSAGKTDFASLPAGQKIDWGANTDDNTITIDLPFTFSYANGPSNKLSINLDGYVVPGGNDTNRYDKDDPEGSKEQIWISPWLTDFMASSAASGVYYSVSPEQVVVRWELQESSDNPDAPILARFAVILKPDNTIRFVYGNPVQHPTGGPATYSPVKIGLGAGNPSLSEVELPFDDWTLANDILYTQTVPVPGRQDYQLYFNGPSVATAPPVPEGIQGFDFTTGNLQGWKSLQDPATSGQAGSDLTIHEDPALGFSMRLDNSKYHHPMAYATGMTPVADGTTYAKFRTGGSENEVGIFQRFNISNIGNPTTGTPGLGTAVDSFGSLMMQIVTTIGGDQHPGPTPLNPGNSYVAVPTNWQYVITATEDRPKEGSGSPVTFVSGKAWQAPWASLGVEDPIPNGFQQVRDSSAGYSDVQPLPAGYLAQMIYATTSYTQWIYIVNNPRSEMLLTEPGAAEVAPNPGAGKAVIEGIVYDQAGGLSTPIGGATVTLTSGGDTLGTAITTSEGRYRLVVNATASAKQITVTAARGTQTGSVTQAVVEGTAYTVNVALQFDARIVGVVTAGVNAGPIAGVPIQVSQGGNVVATVLTDAQGAYQTDLAAGAYDIKATIHGLPSQTIARTLPGNNTVTAVNIHFTLPADLMAAHNLNPSFELEEADPNGTGVRPAAWRALPNGGAQVPVKNPVTELDQPGTSGWWYLTNSPDRAHTGTHVIAQKNIPAQSGDTGAALYVWDLQPGFYVPIHPGLNYKVSVWVKHAGPFDARLRITFPSTPTSESFNGGYTYSQAQIGSGEWQKLTYTFPVNAVDANYMWIRFYAYGANDSAGKPAGTTSTGIVYWDDITVEPLAPEVVSGKVVDPVTGLGVAGVAVGGSPDRNGLADPETTATSDTEGNFRLTLSGPANYSIQAWKPGFAATTTHYDTVANNGTPVTIFAPTVQLTNLATGKPVTTSFSDGTNADEPGMPAERITDADIGSRWASFGINDFSRLPITVTIDLGTPAPTFDQVAILWEVAKAADYMIQTSNDGNSWATVYDSDNRGQYSFIWTSPASRRDVVITLNSPVSARYLRIVNTGFARTLNNLSIFDVQVGLRPAAPLSGAVRALRIAGGLEASTPEDMTNLNAAGGLDINIADAVALVRQGL